MFLRALTLALWCASASALTPLSAAGDDNECALYLTGPGRTSAYDYSLNLLKGNFGYEGQHTCITYDAVNQAYLEARNRIVVSQPKGDWKPEDFASVGELILDISINLARTYGLTYEEIEKGLPLIDTSRTLIREVCPPVFSHVECRAGKYRRLDGLCNNLQHPTWGATNAPFQRLIGPLFADGINAPRISHTGRDLPLSRVVSRTMHPDDGFHDHAGTVMVIAWGQFMDHDYTLTGTPLDPVNRNDPEECCKRPPHLKHPYCNEIRVPEDDYFYRLFGVKCIDFVRGFPSPRPGCRLGSRVPFNTLTGAIDGNTVYGVTDKFARKLRTGYGGLLRMNPVFKEYGLRDLLPLKLDIPDEGCTRPNKNMYCFEAGEIRVNEQLVLTVMHTLMAREHNRIANALAEVNPHWDDETLYQESRRINIAEIQHITYNEFLPILLGKDVMEKFGLVLEKEGYWDGYDQDVNPDVIDSFAAAAYRFGHSLLPTAVERWSKAHKFIASKRLSDLIRRPYDLYRAGVLDEYVMGLMNQVAQAMDDSITQEVTNHLFKKVGARFGMDLVSFNMQRGREFGLPGYMEFRKFCGLSGAETFQDLFGTMSNETVRKYETIFEHPIDVDLWSGGVSERPLPGSMLGPTFACVIATQFSYSRRGDRFWYELPNQPSTFTPEQLTEIRKARLARVICDNTDIIDTVQLYPMVLPDHELNPRVPCRSGIIPSIDFTKWAEPAPFQGSAKQFITDAFALNKYKTGCSNESISTKNNTSIKDIQENHGFLHRDNNCNATNDLNSTQKTNLITLHVAANVSSNNGSNTLYNLTDYCKENSTSDKCIAKLLGTKEIPRSDTVLKYVYNKDDKSVIKEKPKSHPLNSIQRKKRSIETDKSITSKTNGKAPLIVNYETSHPPSDTGVVLPASQHVTGNVIKNSALADFNIKTLHEPDQSSKNNLQPKETSSSQSEENSNESSENKNYSESNSDESSESDYLKKDSNPTKNKFENSESNESKEKEKIRKNESGSSSVEDSREIDDDSDAPEQRKKKQYPDSSFEIYRENKYPIRSPTASPILKHSGESIERDNSKSLENSESIESSENTSGDTNRKKSNYIDHENDSRETNVGNKYRNPESSHEQQSLDNPDKSKEYNNQDDSRHSGENSYENDNDLLRPQNNKQLQDNHEPTKSLHINVSTPRSIQDVDLDDFSYERVQKDDNGHIIAAREHDENDAAVLIKPIINAYIDQNQPIESLLLKEDDTYINRGLFDVDNPVHLNDGEVKPVVELNSEHKRSESHEENSKEALKANSDQDESLETILSSNTNAADKQNKKFAKKEPKNKADVKQQFERIPLNYKHENKQEENNKNGKNDSKNQTPQDEIDEGTLDPLYPKEGYYDEQLKFKFDDVSIKLPDIKLPEDILAYAYENPYEDKKENYEKRKNKPKSKFYQYGEEDSDESHYKPKKSSHNDDNNENEYYGHRPAYDKENLQKKGDDEKDNDGVDLYEKFVRERFGKRGSFEKRSEKLQNAGDLPYNPKLYQNVRNVLKHTAQIDKQAKNSGDPNAGYAWTLEYAENLK